MNIFYCIFFFLIISTFPVLSSDTIILGDDSRVPSANPAVGRLRVFKINSSGNKHFTCTAFLTNSPWIITTGHSFFNVSRDKKSWLEFNVPLSRDNGTEVDSSDENRYEVILDSVIQSENPTRNRGNDWAIFQVKNNMKTAKSPLNKQKVALRIFSENLSRFTEKSMVITGYGNVTVNVDGKTRLNKLNGTQQSAEGKLIKYEPKYTRLSYDIDTNPGCSGAPIILRNSDIVVGLNSGANYSETFNEGTSFTNESLIKALSNKPKTNLYNSVYDSFNKITYVDTKCGPYSDQSDRGAIFSPYQYVQDALYYETEDVMLCIAGGNYPVVAKGVGSNSQQPLISIPFSPSGNGRRVLFCSCAGSVNFLATTAPPPSSGNILKMVATHAAMSRSVGLYPIVEKKMTANRTNQKFSKMCVLQ